MRVDDAASHSCQALLGTCGVSLTRRAAATAMAVAKAATVRSARATSTSTIMVSLARILISSERASSGHCVRQGLAVVESHVI
jgi:hypothetical protein